MSLAHVNQDVPKHLRRIIQLSAHIFAIEDEQTSVENTLREFDQPSQSPFLFVLRIVQAKGLIERLAICPVFQIEFLFQILLVGELFQQQLFEARFYACGQKPAGLKYAIKQKTLESPVVAFFQKRNRKIAIGRLDDETLILGLVAEKVQSKFVHVGDDSPSRQYRGIQSAPGLAKIIQALRDRRAVVGAIRLGLVQPGTVVLELAQNLRNFLHVFAPEVSQGNIRSTCAAFLPCVPDRELLLQGIAIRRVFLAAGRVPPRALEEKIDERRLGGGLLLPFLGRPIFQARVKRLGLRRVLEFIVVPRPNGAEVGGGVMKIAPNAPKKILREIFRWKNLYKEFQKITSI